MLGANAVFPLANVGIASIPIGFLAAWLGSLAGARRATPSVNYDEFIVRATLTS